MKLTWTDFVTAVLVLFGGAVTYAKFYDYSWAMVGGSWRTAIAVIALISLAVFAFSRFNFANLSWLNVGEMVLLAAAIILAVTGMIVASSGIFYSLAGVMGAFWLVDTARHARHSWIDRPSTTFHHHAPVH